MSDAIRKQSVMTIVAVCVGAFYWINEITLPNSLGFVAFGEAFVATFAIGMLWRNLEVWKVVIVAAIAGVWNVVGWYVLLSLMSYPITLVNLALKSVFTIWPLGDTLQTFIGQALLFGMVSGLCALTFCWLLRISKCVPGIRKKTFHWSALLGFLTGVLLATGDSPIVVSIALHKCLWIALVSFTLVVSTRRMPSEIDRPES